MKTLTEQLAQYAAHHRDDRNILTHFVGIPLIVAAVAVLLSRPHFVVAEIMFALGLRRELHPSIEARAGAARAR